MYGTGKPVVVEPVLVTRILFPSDQMELVTELKLKGVALETMVEEHEPPPSPPSKTPKGPTNLPPKVEPSYFDDPGHGEDGGGSKYLD